MCKGTNRTITDNRISTSVAWIRHTCVRVLIEL
jgi:hypothetical protein